MPLSRRDLILGIAPLLGAALAPRSALADVASPRMRRPPRPRVWLHLDGVHVSERQAPAADVQQVHREATLAIHNQRGRIERCVQRMDLRDAPNRRRPRELSLTLTFDRSGRAQVRMGRARGVPAGVRACVREALSAIAIRTAPRGRVALEARYRLG